MKHNVFDGSADFLGDEKPEPKRRTRKPKKQVEKNILYEYHNEIEQERESSAAKQRKIYENMQHLSQGERTNFENKFTKPKNERQEQYVHLLKAKSKKIVVATGPAGTGKTLFATESGVRNFLNGTYEKLIFTRPSVSVDEDLGYLPGTLEEKMAPWVRPIYDILYNWLKFELINDNICIHNII